MGRAAIYEEYLELHCVCNPFPFYNIHDQTKLKMRICTEKLKSAPHMPPFWSSLQLLRSRSIQESLEMEFSVLILNWEPNVNIMKKLLALKKILGDL
jgi:hypothetical protein